MSNADQVTVYNYWVAGETPETPVMSTAKATRETVRGRALGEVLESTAQAVGADEIDADGHYRRVPTGWGQLDELVPQEPSA